MTNAEQAQGQLLELAALRQCFTELALPPAVRQTLDSACTESEKRLQQRLEQMTWQIQRSALLGDIAGKIVHEIRNPLNAIFRAIFSASAGGSYRSRRGPVGSYSICKDSRASALCPSTKGPYSAPL